MPTNITPVTCMECGSTFLVMLDRAEIAARCNSCRVKNGHAHNTQPLRIEEMRQQVIKEIQAFAGDFSHAMTQDGVTRDVLIVEQLIDFLNTPEAR